MVTLYLVRHGQTKDNVARIMQGQTQGELTAEGVSQAEEVARMMAQKPIDAFLSSDLRRSVDTCRIIAKPHGKPVVTTPLLRERDWGDFTGRYIPDLKNAVWPANVESLGAMKERARQFLRLLAKRYDGQCVLAVGHGIINKAIQAVHFGLQMNEVTRMENGEVRVLEIRN